MAVVTKKMYKAKSRGNSRVTYKKSKKNMRGGFNMSFGPNSLPVKVGQQFGLIRKNPEKEKQTQMIKESRIAKAAEAAKQIVPNYEVIQVRQEGKEGLYTPDGKIIHPSIKSDPYSVPIMYNSSNLYQSLDNFNRGQYVVEPNNFGVNPNEYVELLKSGNRSAFEQIPNLFTGPRPPAQNIVRIVKEMINPITGNLYVAPEGQAPPRPLRASNAPPPTLSRIKTSPFGSTVKRNPRNAGNQPVKSFRKGKSFRAQSFRAQV